MLKSQLYHLLFLPLLINAQFDPPFKARLTLDEDEGNSECEYENNICSGWDSVSCPPGSTGTLDRRSAIESHFTGKAANTVVVTTTEGMPTENVTSVTPSPTPPSAFLITSTLTASTIATVTFISVPQSTNVSADVGITSVPQRITSTLTSISTTLELTTIVEDPGPTNSSSSTEVQATDGGQVTTTQISPSPTAARAGAGAGMIGLDEKLVTLGMVLAVGMLM